MLSITDINHIINNSVNFDVINKLKDENLIDEYLNSNSVKNQIENNKINDIINDYLFNLIPSGTKGVIRGNLFNKIIKEYLLNLNLDEIPDWIIKNNSNKKIIVGMNQIDLWNGGHQINRGFKYINNTDYKIISVVCNYIQLKSNKNKIYKLFNIGFSNYSLCYINNLEDIIRKHLYP